MHRGYSLLIVIAALLWSLDALVRRQLYFIPAPFLVTIETLIRILILLPWISKFVLEYKKMKLRDWLVMIVIGVVSGMIGVTLFTAALAQVNDIEYSVVALLQQTQPLFAVILAVLILKEKVTLRFAALGLTAMAAAYVLAFPGFVPTFLGNGNELKAALLALGAAAAWGSGTVLSKLMLSKLSYAATAMLRFIITGIAAMAFSLFSGATYPLRSISTNQWALILFMAVIGGVASFMLYYKGLQHTQAKVSTFAELTYPLTAAFIGFIFLGERLVVVQLIAAAVLLASILGITLNKNE